MSLKQKIQDIIRDHVLHLGYGGGADGWWWGECLANGCAWADRGESGGIKQVQAVFDQHVDLLIVEMVEAYADDIESQLDAGAL